ncbi:aldose 1-epimerase family protein [Foetidibacter luteolus]|uniref:aldose 1-epimerase family protein n=1 Tax=Foetidibacter luteolus TaxID=2608880 RepID=UPI001F2B5D61|nr:aldose 1-epimerase family protein [Foetidibacter luteolus]
MTNWKNKISNHTQIGGIETSVLDNGAGRGTRIAWVNTGTGLRYKIVLDRAMDIADAFYNQYSLAWLSSTGVVPPQPFSNKGADWLKTFGGGLLTTCGLTHVGGPEKDEFGERGVHGGISNTPAEVISIQQPDPVMDKLDMSITGIIKETQIFGPALELKRTISGTLGKAVIKIHDEITNRGNTVAPHMLLYHCNFGWPLVDEGTAINWSGKWQSRDGDSNNRIFNNNNDFHTCPAPMQQHNGSEEDAVIVDIDSDEQGLCVASLNNKRLGFAVEIKFVKKQLPWFTNWQHWGFGEYVTGLEPGTNPPTGQAKARADKQLILLEPGETRLYDLEIGIV